MPLPGTKHPAALGRPLLDVWPEARDSVGPLMSRVMTGESVHRNRMRFVVARHGRREPIVVSDVRIDLLITDVGLPGGMNGRQVADAALVVRPRLKVLFITGYAENAAVGGGQLPPGMQVLTKPFAIQELADRIRELIGSDRHDRESARGSAPDPAQDSAQDPARA